MVHRDRNLAFLVVLRADHVFGGGVFGAGIRSGIPRLVDENASVCAVVEALCEKPVAFVVQNLAATRIPGNFSGNDWLFIRGFCQKLGLGGRAGVAVVARYCAIRRIADFLRFENLETPHKRFARGGPILKDYDSVFDRVQHQSNAGFSLQLFEERCAVAINRFWA